MIPQALSANPCGENTRPQLEPKLPCVAKPAGSNGEIPHQCRRPRLINEAVPPILIPTIRTFPPIFIRAKSFLTKPDEPFGRDRSAEAADEHLIQL